MATPTKNLIDATSPSRMAPMFLPYSPVKLTLEAFGNKAYNVEILNTYNRFQLVAIRTMVPNSLTLSPTTLKLVSSTLAVFKTFPSGYHEVIKQRPTEGQIYPRKRNKNY